MGVKLKHTTAKHRYDIRMICKSKEEHIALTKKFKSLKPCNVDMIYPELLDYLLDKLIESDYNKVHSGKDVENIIKKIEERHNKISYNNDDKNYFIAITYHEREKRNEVKKIFDSITKLAGRKRCNNGIIFEAIIDMVIELNKSKLVTPVKKEPLVEVKPVVSTDAESVVKAPVDLLEDNYSNFKEMAVSRAIKLKIVNDNDEELDIVPKQVITLKNYNLLLSRLNVFKNTLTIDPKIDVKGVKETPSYAAMSATTSMFMQLTSRTPKLTIEEFKNMKDNTVLTVKIKLTLWNKISMYVFHKKLRLNDLMLVMDLTTDLYEEK